ncbi:DUF6049 family protein [Herbiconiux sp. CPCC 205763]|uniref:DUF6049 family protein n=1 Tax=Herbiconiux aconitum TaxID=2970913 RepID=A0ABT2GR54_9MICO|nr:DUF6049 family protein [Herbiconiux aconitum]MCS5717424.1 DUF6049 family protein [Herbiconiux aconitum]
MNPARRLFRVAPAIAASALIAGAVFATPMAASATDAPDPAAPTVALSIAPAGNGVVTPGADLAITVEIANPGPDQVADGTIDIVLDRSPLTSATAYDSWVAGGGAADGDAAAADEDLVTLATAASPAVPLGATHSVQLTVPADQLALGDWGSYGLGARLTQGGAVAAETRSTIVWNDPTADAPPAAGVTVIAPLTSIASTTGLIQAPALETFTSDTGVLTRELDAVIDRPVTIAVDPRIIVSIRALGSTAPDSAVGWLERLEAASNPIIPLTFADSDIAAEHQAGAPGVLAPTSFAYALDPANFIGVDELIEPTATPTTSPSAPGDPTATPAPSTDPTPPPPAVPTLEQLTDWDYTSTSIAWPRTGSVVAADLPFFSQSGLTTSIIDSSQLSAEGDPLDAVVSVGDQTALVADHGVSAAIQDALAANSDARRGQALSQLSGSLAIAAGAGRATDAGSDASGRTVLAVLDRTAMNLTDLDQVLGALQSLPWAGTAPLQNLLAQTPRQAATLIDAPESADRIGQIQRLLGGSGSIDSFSSVLADPQVLTGQNRADLLALLSNSWVPNEGGWNVAVQGSVDATAKTLGSVQMIDGSNINLLSNQAPLPVTLSNELPYPVTVLVHVTPSNGRLLVEQNDVEVTIEATSRKGAQIPVTAVANGAVTLNIQLLSPTGVLISTPSPVVVNVSAEWETWGTVLFGVLVVIVFGFGIVRNILRRRKKRRTDDAAAAENPENAVEAPDAGVTPHE